MAADPRIIRLVGASMPRAGHHLLERLLAAAYGEAFHYCEFYTPKTCCRAIPCTRRDSRMRVSLQKNHDFDLSLPTSIPDATVVVQFREPVPAALSDRELYDQVGYAEFAHNADHFLVWLARRAAYYRLFLRKWVIPHREEHVIINYRELTADGIGVVRRLGSALELSIGAAAERAMRAEAGWRAPPPQVSGRGPFASRVIDDSPHFDSSLMAQFEALALMGAPDLDELRVMTRRADIDESFRLLVDGAEALLNADPHRAAEDFGAAAQLIPQNAFAWHECARARQACDDVGGAIEAAERAIALQPDFPDALRHTSDLYVAVRRPEQAAQHADRVAELRPLDADSFVHAAAVNMLASRQAGALVHLDSIRSLNPSEPEVLRIAGDLADWAADHALAADFHRRAQAPLPAPFIVGVSRSGTTLLRLMLDAHSMLAIPTETHFLADLLASGVQDREATFACLVNHMTWPNMGIDAEELQRTLQAIDPFSVSSAVRAFYGVYAARAGKPRWGDKTPDYRRCIEDLASLLPEARIIHIIRDGRDVALSHRGLWWGPGDDVAAAARYWTDEIATARAAQIENYREVRFEDLVISPETVLADLCDFLELPFEAGMLSYHLTARERLSEFRVSISPEGQNSVDLDRFLSIHDNTHQPPDGRRIDRWRTEMSLEEVLLFESIAGPLLAELGYETSSDRTP